MARKTLPSPVATDNAPTVIDDNAEIVALRAEIVALQAAMIEAAAAADDRVFKARAEAEAFATAEKEKAIETAIVNFTGALLKGEKDAVNTFRTAAGRALNVDNADIGRRVSLPVWFNALQYVLTGEPFSAENAAFKAGSAAADRYATARAKLAEANTDAARTKASDAVSDAAPGVTLASFYTGFNRQSAANKEADGVAGRHGMKQVKGRKVLDT